MLRVPAHDVVQLTDRVVVPTVLSSARREDRLPAVRGDKVRGPVRKVGCPVRRARYRPLAIRDAGDLIERVHNLPSQISEAGELDDDDGDQATSAGHLENSEESADVNVVLRDNTDDQRHDDHCDANPELSTADLLLVRVLQLLRTG